MDALMTLFTVTLLIHIRMTRINTWAQGWKRIILPDKLS